jgi:hypothetical protein
VSRTAEELLATVAREGAQTPPAPVYLVAGELVLAEPAAERIAKALAERAGCAVETHRRPPSLTPLLDDLRTYSLFAAGKVVLAVDSAVLADRSAAAELIDDAAEALPVGSAGGEPTPREREAASRLMQALRLFGADPLRGTPAQALAGLPDWALAGGAAFRKRRGGRGRGKRQVEELAGGLEELLAAGREAGLAGWSGGELAALSSAVEDGLPDSHALVLAERAAPADHPVVASLERRGLVARVAGVESGRGGDWEGLGPLAEELQRQTGSAIERPALAELARRTLRKQGDWKEQGAAADSTARFAAEYRKLAALAGPGGKIDRSLVEESVADRGEEDAFKIFDAVGAGRGGEALARLGRLLAAAEDPLAARLSFFFRFAGYCRRVAAVRGLLELHGVRPGESHYPRFKQSLAPRLQRELPGGVPSPVAGENAYALHRAYLAAGRLSPQAAARIPAWLLETELELKGESGDPAAALSHLVARVAAAAA